MRNFFLTVLLFIMFSASAATYYSRNGGGVWNVAATWSTVGCGGAVAAGAPGTTDNVQICNGDIVTLPGGTTAIRGLTINAGGTLTIDAGQTFDVTRTSSNAGTINGSGGTLRIYAALFVTATFTNSGTISVGDLQVASILGSQTFTSSGTVTVTGPLTFTEIGTTAWNNNNGSVLNVGGALTKDAGSAFNATAATNTVNYNGTGAQTILTTSYYNLSVSTSGTKALAGAIAISRDLTISGTAILASDIYNITGNAAGNLTIGAGATLTLGNTGSATATAFPANYVNTKINLDPASTVIYQSAGAQAISATPTYGGLTAATSGIKTLAGAITVSGALAVTGSATLACDIYNITGNATYTLSMAAGSALTIGNVGNGTPTAFPSGYTNANIALSATSTVIYQSNGTQTISSAPTYGGLTVATSGTKTLAGAITVNGALALTGTVTLACDVYQITGNATYTMTMAPGTFLTLGNTGSAIAVTFPTGFTAGNTILNSTSTVVFQSAGAQTVSTAAVTFGHVTCTTSGIKTLASSVTVNGNLTISGSATLACDVYSITGNATYTMTMTAGTVLTLGNTGSGTISAFPSGYTNSNITLDPASTLVYQSTGAQMVSDVPIYGNLTCATNGVKTLTGAITVNGALSISGSATLACDVYNITGNTTYTFTMASGTSLLLGNTGSATATAFPSGYINANITLNAASTVIYQSTGAQTISATPAYGGLTAATSGTKTLAGAITVNGALAVTGSATLACDVYNITGNPTYTMTMAAGTFLTLGNTGLGTATVFPSGYTNVNIALNAASTVVYQSTGAQTVSAMPVYGNLTCQTGGVKTLENDISVVGNHTIGAGTTLDVTAIPYNIDLKGNWSNGGTFTQQTGSVTFSSATIPQAIGGGISTTFYDLIISNGSTGVTQNTAVTVAGILSLNTGAFILNGRILTVTNASAAAIGRTSGYIVSESTDNSGKVQWNLGVTAGSHLFPFGTSAGFYIPFTFNQTAGNVGNVTASTYPTAADNTPLPTVPDNVTQCGNLTDNSSNTVDRFWQVDITGAGTATLTFTATAAEVGAITNLIAEHWNTATGLWDLPIPGQSNTAISATVPGVTSFSPWTMSGNNNPLPIELLNFGAVLNSSKKVEIAWTTATETNNDYFTIQRSINASDFSTVSVVKGAGNSFHKINYTVLDESPLEGVSYYRLMQTDFDGRYSYSNVVAVQYTESGISFTLYPNPSVSGETPQLRFNTNETKDVLVVVYDAIGNEIFSKISLIEKGTRQVVAIDPSKILPPGVYVISVSSDSTIYKQKLIIK